MKRRCFFGAIGGAAIGAVGAKLARKREAPKVERATVPKPAKPLIVCRARFGGRILLGGAVRESLSVVIVK